MYRTNFIFSQIAMLFCRQFLETIKPLNYSPKFKLIDNYSKNELESIESMGSIVIKRDGLCSGKGVLVEDIDFNRDEIEHYK